MGEEVIVAVEYIIENAADGISCQVREYAFDKTGDC
jgi:hypothetical protein